MDEYSALAQRIALSAAAVRGSLILSRDGLVLGAFPEGGEGTAKAAWLRFVVLGEPDRGFVEFTDQVWAFVHRGPYSAFCVAEAGTRPGVLVDQMEQVLLAAEEGRTRRDTLRLPDAGAAPSGKPRTSLHPTADRPQTADTPVGAPSEVVAAKDGGDAIASGDPAAAGGHWRRTTELRPDAAARPSAEIPFTAAEIAASTEEAIERPADEQQRPASPAGERSEDDPEVDRVLLAKEFSGLLQVDPSEDEESS
jgi:hypothetical protein